MVAGSHWFTVWVRLPVGLAHSFLVISYMMMAAPNY